jgi:hypothetical protein
MIDKQTIQVSQFLPLLHCSAVLLWFKNLFCNSALLHAILLFFSCFLSCFCLFNDCYSSLSFISCSAYCNFTLLTVHLIFPVRTTNLTQSLHLSFYTHQPHQLHFESPWAKKKTSQQLNRQPIKNHDSIMLTET